MNCHFCGESIIKMSGKDSDSLLIHSLDGNHNNWDPKNKVPVHRGCHSRFHISGNKNPMERPEARKKLSLATTGENNHWFGTGGPMKGKHHTAEAKDKNKKLSQQMWDNMTPEQRAEHGKKISEGIRKARERREKQ